MHPHQYRFIGGQITLDQGYMFGIARRVHIDDHAPFTP